MDWKRVLSALFFLYFLWPVSPLLAAPLPRQQDKSKILSMLKEEAFDLAFDRFEKNLKRRVVKGGKEHQLMQDVLKELGRKYPQMMSEAAFLEDEKKEDIPTYPKSSSMGKIETVKEENEGEREVVRSLKASAYNITLLPNAHGVWALVAHKKNLEEIFRGCPRRTLHVVNSWDLPTDRGGEEKRLTTILFGDEKSLRKCARPDSAYKLAELGVEFLTMEEKKEVQNPQDPMLSDLQTPQYISLELALKEDKALDKRAFSRALFQMKEFSPMAHLFADHGGVEVAKQSAAEKLPEEVPVPEEKNQKSGATQAFTRISIKKATESRLTAPFVLEVVKKWGDNQSSVWEVEVRPIKKKSDREPRRMTFHVLNQRGQDPWNERKSAP